MAISGLDKNVNVKIWCDSLFGIYERIIKDIVEGRSIDQENEYKFKNGLLGIISLQGLTEEEEILRDVYVKKFLALIDILFVIKDLNK